MSEEDKKLQKHLVDEMMKVYQTNPDVMIYMDSLMKKYEELEEEIERLNTELELYKDNHKHLNTLLEKKDNIIKEVREYINNHQLVFEISSKKQIAYWFDMFYKELLEILEEDKKDKEIEVYVNGEKIDITDIYEPLKQGEYFYKENDKWYVHKLKYVSKIIEEDKKIKKLILEGLDIRNVDNLETELGHIQFKINEIIDCINKGDK